MTLYNICLTNEGHGKSRDCPEKTCWIIIHIAIYLKTVN